MLLADITLSTSSLTVVGAVVAALASSIALLFKLLMASKDRQIAEAEKLSEIHRIMAAEAVRALETIAGIQGKARGETPVPFLAPVVPEQNSPVTVAQIKTAELQTLRARMTAAFLALGVPARVLDTKA